MPSSTQQALQQVQEEPPADIEIQVGEAAQGPLARVANAFARAISVAGEALYDYSGGQYGLHPRDAKELRHEWKRERKLERELTQTAADVAVRERIGGHQWRAWLPVVVGVVAGTTALAIWQRRRLQAAAVQAVALGRRTAQQVQHQMASRSAQPPSPPAGSASGYTSTPALDRVARGELLSPSSVGGVASMNGAGGSSGATPPGSTGADTISG